MGRHLSSEEPGVITDTPPIDLRKPVRRDVIARQAGSPTHLSVVELKLAQHHMECTEYAPVVNGLIIGENPGPNTHADLPLFPWPAKSSAGRLMAMGQLTPGEYLGGLYRRNLCDDKKWRESKARIRAREILTALFDLPRTLRVVLCGVKVASAFDVRHVDFWWPIKLDSRQQAVVIPHPSGMNRIYNDPQAQAQTRAWVRWAALGEVAPR